jgi:hypothetical protein
LWPGRSSESGFLGRDERLADVIAADAESLARLGVTHEQLANALDHILDSALAQIEDAVDLILNPTIVRLTDDFVELKTDESESALARLKDKAAGLNVDDRYWVDFAQYLGSQHCPWGVMGECSAELKHSSIDWTITSSSGAQLAGPGMIGHLIRSHHFFEGRSVRYRVGPIELAQLLDLA